MDRPVYSFITCTYQCGHFVKRCYWSLTQQTLLDWEWVVVDDGSSDDTEKIIAELGDPRVRYFRLEKNRGRGIARSHAFQQARGVWSAIIDMDDVCFPDRLEQAEKARKEGFDFFCSTLLLIDDDYRVCGGRDFKKDTYPRLFPHGSLCAKTQLLQSIGYPVYRMTEDQTLMLTLANQSRGYFCDLPVYIYHENASINLKTAFMGHFYVFHQLRKLVKKKVLKSCAAIYRMQLSCLLKQVSLLPFFIWPKSYLRTLALRSAKLSTELVLSEERRVFIEECAKRFPLR